RHDAVIGGHHKNDDVGRLGAARAHGGERLVSWGIEESHHAARRLNVISADMLRDAARFSRSDTAAANVIQQRSLAMVDVTHDGHYRWTRLIHGFDGSIFLEEGLGIVDRKSTRLNSSHVKISYAVLCLKKEN